MNKYTVNIKGKLTDLSHAKVMGILNVTPDSFYDGGKHRGIDGAMEQCEQMLTAGADFIDVGGESTRPGSVAVDAEEELRRVIPVIEQLAKRFPSAIFSIDTHKARVAAEAVEAGADMVNDISAGDDDPDMLSTIAGLNVPYIFMHKQGKPATMQLNPVYTHVVNEVFDYLNFKKQQLYSLGIADVIADIGFGFGKTMEHNYTLAANIKRFSMLECPLLVGISRKGMVYKKLGTTAEHALNGSSVLHALILSQTPAILRVHDVKEAVETIKIVEAWGEVEE